MPSSMISPNRVINHSPLTSSLFSEFGAVIENPTTFTRESIDQLSVGTIAAPRIVPANQNTALKLMDVSPVSNTYAKAPSQTVGKPVMNVFSCFPRELSSKHSSDGGLSVFKLRLLERHPFTTQTFIPMGLSAADPSTKYLVIVAPTLPPTKDFPSRGPPDLANVRAFLGHGGQGVTYGEGTWHVPMVVVGKKRVDFAVVQYCNGVPEEDCEEMALVDEGGEGLEILQTWK